MYYIPSRYGIRLAAQLVRDQGHVVAPYGTNVEEEEGLKGCARPGPPLEPKLFHTRHVEQDLEFI